jgi:2-polyprenyl-3-methyl-5-hydroxy-6-metoxy-1,4-benzoquinol methylase
LSSPPHVSEALNYPDNLNPDLLARIPLDAETVLDVGCHTGLLGAIYRQRNPRVRYFGIDSNPGAIRIAATRLTQAAMLDVETDPLPFAAPGGYDCIIYGDVLEHLRDPWKVLRAHAALLSPKGVMLVCVPNAAHWNVTRRLLDGSFDYEDQGVLDRTHLRWFTLDSMRKALIGTGLALCDVWPRVFDQAEAERFADLIKETLAGLGISRQTYLARAAPLQYVWRVRRTAAAPIAIRATMLKPHGGVSDIRVLYPLRAVQTDPSVTVQVGEVESFPDPTAQLPALCILHRPLLVGPEGVAAFRYLLRRGFLVVTEFDDRPDFIPALRDEKLMNFRAAHAVQTSTPVLAEILRAQNPEVGVFANGVAQLPQPENFRSGEKLTLFFGAINRVSDWGPMMPALNAAAALLRDRLHFCVVGDRAFYEALESPNKTFTALCDHQTYMRLLGQCEISFMPLQDTPFNRAKSDLKFIEAGAARVAALASPVVYGETIEDGVTGLLFRDQQELQDRLVRLASMPALALSVAEAALKMVAATRMDAYQVGARIRWYRSLLDRREELTRALLDRVPELRT